MVYEKEEFEDWDGGDYESMFAEAEETDHPEKSKFKPTDRKSVPWAELCDLMQRAYDEGGVTRVRRLLTQVRAARGGDRSQTPIIDTLYERGVAGDRGAWDVLYDLYYYVAMQAAARVLGREYADEVEDVVHNAWISLLSKPQPGIREFGGMLVRLTEWRATDFLREQTDREVELVSIEDIRNDQGEPMSLDELEKPGMEHPWLTATTTETPESIATAADLSRLIAKFGHEAGPHKYAVFCAVEIDNVPINTICREFNVDQSTAYRWVAQVRSHVRDRLIEEGFDL